jgi:hypothetical protein
LLGRFTGGFGPPENTNEKARLENRRSPRREHIQIIVVSLLCRFLKMRHRGGGGAASKLTPAPPRLSISQYISRVTLR